jgi:2-polyprenyl-3-methyl-5-hydroxy-6-metoxy-1,4-benzoquinol methylase
MPYEPQGYWDALLADEVSARTVGYPELPRSFNLHAHEAGRRSVRRALAAARASAGKRSVVDLGAGAGLWVDFWLTEGAGSVTATDLSPAAVAALAERFPAVDTRVADVADVGIRALGEFDLVSAMNVLLHVTDPSRFATAIGNIAALTRPGGHVVLLEPVIFHRWWRPIDEGASARVRSFESWRTALADAGLHVAAVRPTTALLASVVDTRHRLTFEALWLYWSALTKLIGGHERRGDVAGRALGVLDRAATRVLRSGPSGKCIVAIRQP